MHKLVELSEKVEKEVGKIASKNELSLVDIEAACKAVKLIKEIEEVLDLRGGMMEEEPYGRSYSSRGYGTRQIPRLYRASNNYKGIDYGYYGHGQDKEMAVDKLEALMTNSSNEQLRQIIAETIDRINRSGN